MATLKNTKIEGNLDVSGNLTVAGTIISTAGGGRYTLLTTNNL